MHIDGAKGKVLRCETNVFDEGVENLTRGRVYPPRIPVADRVKPLACKQPAIPLPTSYSKENAQRMELASSKP